MSKRLVFFFIIIVLGSAVILGIYFAQPYLADRKQRETSDARGTKGTITVGIDNWIGYFPLCSKEMKKRMRGSGYLFKCIDDQADYPSRMKELRKESLDFAVATVDSFILNGARENFPGIVVMVIDESKGGDAIVARKDKVESLESLKKSKEVKIAFTPSSPSEHLLKSVAVHFDIPMLRDRRGKWRVETDGSSQALKKLLAGKVDVAVLWEPDVSRALADSAIVKLLGTDDTHKLIVDILLANRDLVTDRPEVVQLVLSNYFRALKVYRDNPEKLAKEVVDATDLSRKQVDRMLKGVDWTTLSQNAVRWFGVTGQGTLAQEGLVETIESTVEILLDNKDFRKNPIPDEDAYRLKNRMFVETLHTRGIGGGFSGGKDVSLATESASLERKFSSLSKQAWKALTEIGTLKIRPITFQSGTSALSFEGKRELDKAAANLKHYPNFRVIIRGHTGLRGDPQANQKLSLERAESVRRYLMVTYNVDGNRLHAVGLGAQKPLSRKPGESTRAYNYRLPRVELYLVSEEY